MRQIADPNYEHPTADPLMVNELVHAISDAIGEHSVPNITTTADVLSALFTMLGHALRLSKKDCSPDDQIFNSAEISRVLMDFLIEFGNSATKH